MKSEYSKRKLRWKYAMSQSVMRDCARERNDVSDDLMAGATEPLGGRRTFSATPRLMRPLGDEGEYWHSKSAQRRRGGRTRARIPRVLRVGEVDEATVRVVGG